MGPRQSERCDGNWTSTVMGKPTPRVMEMTAMKSGLEALLFGLDTIRLWSTLAAIGYLLLHPISPVQWREETVAVFSQFISLFGH